MTFLEVLLDRHFRL